VIGEFALAKTIADKIAEAWQLNGRLPKLHGLVLAPQRLQQGTAI
jgi:hypothetical protein